MSQFTDDSMDRPEHRARRKLACLAGVPLLLVIGGVALAEFPFSAPPVPVVTEESRRRVERWDELEGKNKAVPADAPGPTTSLPADLPASSSRATEYPPALVPAAAPSDNVYEARPGRLYGTDLVPRPLPAVGPSAAAAQRHDMDAVQQRADEYNRRAFGLAVRGAFFSAQAEFIRSARIIAQALDAQEGGARHARSLTAGLTALDEADDFAAVATGREGHVSLADLFARHRTPLFKDTDVDEVTALVAMQRYYTYAQEQLAFALGRDRVGSVSLYGLGKLYALLPADRAATIVADAPKAIAAYQAALVVDERNFLAAHELGVMLARCGHFEAARMALAHAAVFSPYPETWSNLASVHERLGQHDFAAQARRQAQLLATRPAAVQSNIPGSPQKPVVWVDQGEFARTNRNAESPAQESVVRGAKPPVKTR